MTNGKKCFFHHGEQRTGGGRRGGKGIKEEGVGVGWEGSLNRNQSQYNIKYDPPSSKISPHSIEHSGGYEGVNGSQRREEEEREEG